MICKWNALYSMYQCADGLMRTAWEVKSLDNAKVKGGPLA